MAGTPWSGRCHKVKFAGGGADAMQAKEKTRLKSFNEKLEGSSLQGGVSRKIATSLSVAGRLKNGCIRVRPEMAQDMAINSHMPRVEGPRVLRASRCGYNQEKN